MKPDTQLLKTVWEHNKQNLSTSKVGLNRLEIDRLISSIFSNGPSYFYTLDTVDAGMQLDFVSPDIKDIHGLDPRSVTFQDILDQVHPDDMYFVAKAEAKAFELLMEKIAPKNRKKYKFSYCFRFRTADGSYQLFNHQAIVLTTDEYGRHAKALNIHTNISHLADKNNYRLSAIGMFGEPSFLNIGIVDGERLIPEAKPPLSNREIQVIKLMSQGLTSIEIADQLCISQNTVKNHRRSILQKSDCKNTGQLITKCMNEGLI